MVLLVSAIAALIYGLGFCYRGTSWAGTIFKTVSTAGLALTCWVTGAPHWLVAGLAFGALGDYMLSREGETHFLVGLVAFAVAHIAYIALFVTVGQADFSSILTVKNSGAMIALLVLCGVMVRFLWPATGDLRWPVMGYIAIIFGMGISAIALPETLGMLPVIAAVCFIISDTVLAFEMFLLSQTSTVRRVTPFIVWGLYWAAQAMFALAFGKMVQL